MSMQFPPTNKARSHPVPEKVQSNAKILEEKLQEVQWSVFIRFYLFILGLGLLTVFSFLVVVGIAKWLISLL